ncbi:hypothetical protein L2E82_12571 [Cichorium intybus]|uniref:Uncharacterized protein n=1 Tax=Cichorium intybus TaxID=13427 RepID=A0ACB9GHI2_CICIN|nr:hypothetical protein L2E82_12571 [Cichorium intybus]
MEVKMLIYLPYRQMEHIFSICERGALTKNKVRKKVSKIWVLNQLQRTQMTTKSRTRSHNSVKDGHMAE